MSVSIVDVVTIREFNLYADLLDLIDRSDPKLASDPPSTYAVTCRSRKIDRRPLLDTWLFSLEVGQPLPTLPLWLAEDLEIPLDLEPSYEQTCRVLRIA